jgi:hypothetical protein
MTNGVKMIGRFRQLSPRAAASTIAVGALAAIAIACGSGGGSSTASAAAKPSTSVAQRVSASQLAPIHGPYHPAIDPANFVRTINNPFFPLIPGTAFHYRGVHENGRTRQADDEFVTHKTKLIMGVTATVIRDVVSERGHPIEKTLDWYAQDKSGNVWYMGEDTRELVHGRFVKANDSWQGGVNGAEPGIIMPGQPRPGDAYRQEYYPGHALDQARVLGKGGPQTVPYGPFKHTLMTVETSPKIDPGVAERKFYVSGVGDIREHTVKGNHEQIRLVSITH